MPMIFIQALPPPPIPPYILMVFSSHCRQHSQSHSQGCVHIVRKKQASAADFHIMAFAIADDSLK